MHKSILIFTQIGDVTTDKVISWLIYNKIEVQRVNCEIKCTGVQFLNSLDIELKFGTISVCTSKFTAIWIRRGYIQLDKSYFQSIQPENNTIEDYVNFIVESNSKTIGTFSGEKKHNKLKDLLVAKSLGLNTPDTYIVSSKEQIHNINLLFPNRRYLTKAFHNNYEIIEGNYIYSCGNPILLKEIEYPDYFSPSLIQEEIKKSIDIRVFIFKNTFFSSAIVSQNNPNTRLSFKNYDKKIPNRIVSYRLPNEIELKVRKLIEYLDIDTCSIDLILSKNGDFYFLEINRQGQLDWISESCNFNIEKYIAENLIVK